MHQRRCFLHALFAVALVSGCQPPSRKIEFDSTRWKAQRGVGPKENTRASLLPVLTQVLQPGMTRAQIHELLGLPEGQSESSDTYHLGIAPYGIDQEFYEIRYDAQNKLVDHRLQRG